MKFQQIAASILQRQFNESVSVKPHTAKHNIGEVMHHGVKAPCPGSCGSACPNHYCPPHNGMEFVRDDWDAVMKSKPQWRSGK